MSRMSKPIPISATHRRLMREYRQAHGCDARTAHNATLVKARLIAPIVTHGAGDPPATDVWEKYEFEDADA